MNYLNMQPYVATSRMADYDREIAAGLNRKLAKEASRASGPAASPERLVVDPVQHIPVIGLLIGLGRSVGRGLCGRFAAS